MDMCLTFCSPIFRPLDRLTKEANLIVTMAKNDRHTVVMHPDPTAPGGERPEFKGYMVTVNEYLAQGLNFS